MQLILIANYHLQIKIAQEHRIEDVTAAGLDRCTCSWICKLFASRIIKSFFLIFIRVKNTYYNMV